MILIDTDILIDVSHNIDMAIDALSQHESETLSISSMTEMELLVGCRNKAELRQTIKFLNRFRIIPVNEMISYQAVQLIRQYNLSHGLLIVDAIIAATALSLSLPLLSKNQRDYRFIDSLNLIPYPVNPSYI